MNKFSDFAEPGGVMDGRKASLDSLVGKEIIVTGFRIASTKYTESKSPHCLTVQFCREAGGEKFVFFTGSKVLREQLERYQDKLPFQATIKKIGRYYTFS